MPPCTSSITTYNVSCPCYRYALRLRLCPIVSFISLIISILIFLNSECEKAWTSIANDPAASTCLSLQQFLPVWTAAQNNASLVTPITNWLTSLCSQPECSKDTLSAIYKSVTTKCPPPEQWAFLEPTVYPTGRKFLCLKKFAFLPLLSWTVSNLLSQCKRHALCHRDPYKRGILFWSDS